MPFFDLMIDSECLTEEEYSEKMLDGPLNIPALHFGVFVNFFVNASFFKSTISLHVSKYS